MRANYHSLLINLSTLFTPLSPSPFTTFTPNFEHILANVSSILYSASSSSSAVAARKELVRAMAANCAEPDPENISILAFAVGAIQPLFLVATKCEDVGMRMEAVKMLEEQPWREGAWDSVVMAGIARRRERERAGGMASADGEKGNLNKGSY